MQGLFRYARPEILSSTSQNKSLIPRFFIFYQLFYFSDIVSNVLLPDHPLLLAMVVAVAAVAIELIPTILRMNMTLKWMTSFATMMSQLKAISLK